jgi:hypothetical protein
MGGPLAGAAGRTRPRIMMSRVIMGPGSKRSLSSAGRSGRPMAALGLGPRNGSRNERPFAGSAADLAADHSPGDVTTVLPRHEALLRADKAVLGMKRTRLVGGDLAFAMLLIDALVLVGEASIDFGATRMSLLPGRRPRQCGWVARVDGHTPLAQGRTRCSPSQWFSRCDRDPDARHRRRG